MRYLSVICLALAAHAQADGFVDDFDNGERDWSIMTGDGDATMSFAQADGAGLITVDARADRHNLWWALVRHSVSAHIDGGELARPDRELRVEARIRVSHAPRRVNLHLNHSRTTDFHSHLMEFDIPYTGNWHVISFTTRGFDAAADDEVFVQMALMDWGRDRYTVEVDYVKVAVVDPVVAGPDLGEPLPYRPDMPPLGSFSHRLVSEAGNDPVLAVGGALVAQGRWDFSDVQGCVPTGWGVLELTTRQAHRPATGPGELRVAEIPAGSPLDAVLDSQMIVDVPVAQAPGAKTLATISPPVLRRLLDGRTSGLAIFSQGALIASFEPQPVLFLNLDGPGTGCTESHQ